MGDTGRIRVFLADDHAIVREGLAALIGREADFEVVGQCGDGLLVVNQVLDLKPDVAILDITMPGLNGLDVCRELARKARFCNIVILTMHDDDQFIAKALENGAAGYLLKEAAAGALAEAIRAVSRGELYLGPGIPRHILKHIGKDNYDPHNQLTHRERQVLQLIAEGKTNRQIAENLKLSIKTVDTHRCHLMRKLDIHDQTSLVKYAIRRGIVTLH